MKGKPFLPSAGLVLSAGLLLAWAPWVWGQDTRTATDEIDAQARALVEAVLGETGADDGANLQDWADAVIAGALAGADGARAEQSVADGGPPGTTHPPLVAAEESLAAMAEGLEAGRAGASEVIVFASLSMPRASWGQWSRQAARLGTPLVLRGIAEGGFAVTVERIAARGVEGGAGVTVDPRLFRLFRIGHVPAVAVVPGGVAPCTSPGCSADAPPEHDLVTGNIGLEAALEAIAREGGPGRGVATRHLAVLRGETE